MDNVFMQEAIKEALKAQEKDEVPIGAVIVKDNKIIARAHNMREQHQMATAHAEMLAIDKACKKVGSWRLIDCTLYVTLEPCVMCTGATILSRIDHIVYGAKDPKGGCIESCAQLYDQKGFNHYPTFVSGVMEEECSKLLSEFFAHKRKIKKERKDLK